MVVLIGAVDARAQEAGSTSSKVGNAVSDQALSPVTVYKRENCSCCSRWVEHLEENGFDVEASSKSDLTSVKNRAGVPDSLRSCHTAFVGDYVVEGHVPADLIKQMLREQPDIAGLTVPGMPVGSPGMEMEGREPDSYDVIAFTEGDSTRVYARR